MSNTVAKEKEGTKIVSKISDEEQPKFPWRPALALLIGPAGWAAPFTALNAVLLPAKVANIAPDQKVAIVALVTSVTMIVSLISGIIFGALSDMTRSRFGSRTPWVIGGAIAGSLCLIVFAMTDSLPVMLVAWWAYDAFFHAITAAGTAWLPDRVAPRWRGSASAMFGVAGQIGNLGVQAVAAQFMSNIPAGVILALVAADICVLVACVICKEPSNKHEEPVKFDLSAFRNFLPPLHGSRDYYLAALARMLWMMPGGIGTYRLFTLTDYMHQTKAQAADWMSLMASLSLVIGIVFCLLSGPLADRFHTVKIPCVIAVFVVCVPCWLPFFDPTPMTYTIYVAISAIGGGIFNALDQTIMTSVLPDAKTAAKDLAFINVAGTIGNLLAPIVAAAVIGAFGYRGLFPMGFIILSCSALCILAIKRVH